MPLKKIIASTLGIFIACLLGVASQAFADPIPLPINGFQIEADAFASGAWATVNNGNRSELSFSVTGTHAGSRGARALTVGDAESGYIVTEMQQVIDLSGLGVADLIDANRIAASFSAFGKSQGDFVHIWFECLDGLGNSISRIEPVKVEDSQNQWREFSLSGIRLPSGTRQLRLVYGLGRLGGITTDAYLDGPVTGFLSEVEPVEELPLTVPLSIDGADIESSAYTAGHWTAVNNNNRSELVFDGSGANAGARVARSITRGDSESGRILTEMEQTLDLAGLGLDEEIDAGMVSASFSAFGKSVTVGDFAQIWFDFKDAQGNRLGSVAPAIVNDGTSTWVKMQLEYKRLPKGTRQIRLVVGLTRSGGVTTDAYLDGKVEGFLHRAERIPLTIRGDEIEANAINSGDWTKVNTNNRSAFSFTVTGVNPGVGARTITTGEGPESGYIITEMEQTLELAGLGLDEAIDAGRVSASFSAFGKSVTVGDFAHLGVEFLDVAGNNIRLIAPVTVNDGANIWTQMRLYDKRLPAGTRKIRLAVGLTRSGGVTTDAYLDGKVEGFLTRYPLNFWDQPDAGIDLSFGAQVCGMDGNEEQCLDLDGDGLVAAEEVSIGSNPNNYYSGIAQRGDGASVSVAKPVTDYDNDGAADKHDSCPLDARNDIDGDGICGNLDNCPLVANEDQADVNSNGIGDACQCGDLNEDGAVDTADLSLLNGGKFRLNLNQLQRCDVDGDGFCTDNDNTRLATLVASPATAAIQQQCGGETQLIDKALHRIGFGFPYSGNSAEHRQDSAEERDRIYRAGLDSYLNEQLNPLAISDSVFDQRRLGYASSDNGLGLPVLGQSYPFLRNNYCGETNAVCLKRDDHGRIKAMMAEVKFLRSVLSTRQLDAVLSDFWFNHFNVYGAFGDAIWHLPAYQDMLDQNMYGPFEDLLLEVTLAPAMMSYLTLDGSSKAAPNENYAREVMELHTLGLDGTYDEQQITQVARILTGWKYNNTLSPVRGAFDASKHDSSPKSVTIAGETWLFAQAGADSHPANARCNNVEAVAGPNETRVFLCKLARHEKTARFVGKKLIKRFIGDAAFQQVGDENGALLADMMLAQLTQAWLTTHGDLSQVLRELLTMAPTGLSPQVYGSYFERSLLLDNGKVKRPLVHAASVVKAWGASLAPESSLLFKKVSASAASFNGVMGLLAQQGEDLYSVAPPTGYPEASAAWLGDNRMLKKLDFVETLEPWTSDNTLLPALIQRTTVSNEGLVSDDTHYFHSYVFDNNKLVTQLAGRLNPGGVVDPTFLSALVSYLNSQYGSFASPSDLNHYAKNTSALVLEQTFNAKQMDAAKAILLHPGAFYH